ncbi:hypothetical protein B0T25DRAFT_603806 [Lasiosphaeria hispida]|uniref:Uncharacterized protein n=1 Tax=Lasiosphaeria hispida TaxID=260671 RepID=A0AAJ0MFU5_9PEZI|nr:hypothetical protein B0T25DRAFT_603806 [Lasiosphaeria hispida]
MHFRHILTALAGLGSLAAAAPASERDGMPAEKGLKHKTRAQVGSSPFFQQTQAGLIGQALGAVSQLAKLAELELISMLQSQVALISQLQTIRNNIRANHFQARFSQVNTVIVTVTNVVDARDPANINRRYLMSHLRVDNGFPEKEQVVMVTEQDEMTISATPTPTGNNLIANLLAAASAGFAAPTQGFGFSQNIVIGSFDPNSQTPFSLLNQTLLLPYDTAAPTNALVVEDPANIISPGQPNLVESINSLQTDCAQLVNSNSFLSSALQLFGSVQAAVTAQLTSIRIGSRVQAIPPTVLLSHPDLAALASAQAAAQQATATEGATATTTTATVASGEATPA